MCQFSPRLLGGGGGGGGRVVERGGVSNKCSGKPLNGGRIQCLCAQHSLWWSQKYCGGSHKNIVKIVFYSRVLAEGWFGPETGDKADVGRRKLLLLWYKLPISSDDDDADQCHPCFSSVSEWLFHSPLSRILKSSIHFCAFSVCFHRFYCRDNLVFATHAFMLSTFVFLASTFILIIF